MPTHYPYPSIEQFRHTQRNVQNRTQYIGNDENGDAIYNRLAPLPVLDYQGVTKIHGTNFAMCKNKETGEIWFQSREQIITPEKDNAGAARFFHDKDLSSIFDQIDGNIVVVYGEWCGTGIQKGVSISQVPKRLVIFDINVDGNWLKWKDVAKIKDRSLEIYNVYDYAIWNLKIDFNRPEDAQNELVKITEEIEKCCPVGKAFGVEGVGEGAVWRCITPGWEDPRFFMKIKGDKHAGSKVITLKPVDTERVATLRELAEKVTPVWRLEQMLEKACDLNNGGFIDTKLIGNYFKLLNQDICKEDLDLIQEAGVEFKDIVKYVTEISKKYFLGREQGN